MLDCQLYGLKAGGHHLTNVLLHAATAILLFLVLRNLTGAFWPQRLRGGGVCRASVAGGIGRLGDRTQGCVERFVLHADAGGVCPLRAKAVEGRRSRAEGRHFDSGSRRSTLDLDYALALFFFALGLLSKTMLVTLPFVLLLLDYWPLHRLELSTLNSQLSTLKRLLLEKIPFLLLSAAACGATLLAQKGAIQSAAKSEFLPRIGNALVSYAVYIRQMFYPAGLAVFYPHPGNQLSVWTVGLVRGGLDPDHRGGGAVAAPTAVPAGGLAVVSGHAGARDWDRCRWESRRGRIATPTCRSLDCISWWPGVRWNWAGPGAGGAWCWRPPPS